MVDDNEIEEPQLKRKPPEQLQIGLQENADMETPAAPLDTASTKGKNKRCEL